MDERLGSPTSGPLVLLFGPLALSFDEAAFNQIRKTVLLNEDHCWILETIAEFPHYWRDISTALPSLHAGPGLKQLEDLKQAFLTGQPLETPFPLPNTLLMPLVVISHLMQYVAFLKCSKSDHDDHIDLFAVSKRDRETLGLCTGILSAIAVSSTNSKEQFLTYGAAAVRLSILIGMVVDAREATSEAERFQSLSAAWTTLKSDEGLLHVLKDFPEVSNCSLILEPSNIFTIHICHLYGCFP